MSNYLMGITTGRRSLLVMMLKVEEHLQLRRLLPTQSDPTRQSRPALQLLIGLTVLLLRQVGRTGNAPHLA
jgi:hypothetical protein